MDYIKIDEAELAKVCAEVESIALEFEFKLEKNLDSVEKIELMLDFLREMGNSNAIAGSYFMCSVYLGEILKNSIGGEWVYSVDNEKIALKVNNEFIFPESPVREFFNVETNGGLVFFVKTMMAKFGGRSF